MKLEGITKSFGEKKVLDNITCEFYDGLNIIIGESGEGKSTLLNIIGHLEDPDEGDIFWRDNPISKQEESYYRAITGFVFQDSNLIKGLTVAQNIQIGLHINGLHIDEINIRTDKLLEEFDIKELKNEKVENLSGGEKQRVAIVRAVAKDARILLADEPTGNLDKEHAVHVFEMLKEISKSRTVIIVTHDIELANIYGDSVYRLHNGKLKLEHMKKPVKQKEELTSLKMLNHPKHKIPYQIIYQLNLNSISRHMNKFTIMIITMALSCSFIFIAFIFRNGMNSSMENMSKTYYNIDEIDVYSLDFSENDAVRNILTDEGLPAFTNEDLTNLRKNELFAEVITYHDDVWLVEKTSEKLLYKPITLDDFFRSRLMDDTIEGAFPDNKMEIIISEDLAERLYNGRALGQEITLCNNYGNELTFVISGINHQYDVDGICNTYICADAITGIIRKPFSYCNMLISQYSMDNMENTITEDASGYFIKQPDDDMNVIYGDNVVNDNEIIVSISIFMDLYKALTNEETHISPNGSNITDFFDEVKIVFDELYYIGATDVFSVNVVGIHDGKEDIIITSEEFYDRINTEFPNSAQCYVKNINDLELLREEETIDGLSFYSYYLERFERVAGNNKVTNIILNIILCISMMVFFFVTQSLIKVILNDKTAEIGILKSLGIYQRDLKRLICSVCMMMGFAEGGITCIISVAFVIAFEIATDYSFGNIWYVGITLLLTVILSIIMIIGFGLYSSGKLIREKPVDTLKK